MARAIDINLWYEALATTYGVIIEVEDPDAVKQKLYALRAKSPDPDLASLSIVTSPTNPTRELWIVKKDKAGDAS